MIVDEKLQVQSVLKIRNVLVYCFIDVDYCYILYFGTMLGWRDGVVQTKQQI